MTLFVQNLVRTNFLSSVSRQYCNSAIALKYAYNIPERYCNSFYLANASLFDVVNWYLHRSYEVGFSGLVQKLQLKNPALDGSQIVGKIKHAIGMMEQCNSMTDIRFPIKKEDGSFEVVRGFRAQHGSFPGYYPSLGGLTIRDTITRDQVKALSVLATYKHLCMGIRLSGAHGGIKINPSNYTNKELEDIVKTYMMEIRKRGYCNGLNDIIEPDFHTGQQDMSWAYSNCIEGKPSVLEKVKDYEETSSQGVFFAMDYFLNDDDVLKQIDLEKGLKGKTFIIQGLGKIGRPLLKYLENSGAICIGVKEPDAYIYDSAGIDVKALLDYMDQHKTIFVSPTEKYEKALPLTDDKILTEQCDILILAAHHKSLICYIADKVKAKVIVEAANGAITPTSNRILLDQSKLIIPDLYACSGCSVAFYLEHLLSQEQSKKSGKNYAIQDIYKNMLESMTSGNIIKSVASNTSQSTSSCDMRHCTMTYAIENITNETASDVLRVMKECNLKLDVRSACYLRAIHFALTDNFVEST